MMSLEREKLRAFKKACAKVLLLLSHSMDFNHTEQGRINSKFEGGAVGSGGAEKFSEIGDECKPYTTISDPNY